MPSTAHGPVPLFGKVPCPRCGKPTEAVSNHPLNNLGFAAFVFVFPFTSKQHCKEHGELDFAEFPAGSSSTFLLRRLIFAGGGLCVLAVLLGLLVLLLRARHG